MFDGYYNGTSTKDYEHTRRATKHSPDIIFNIDIPVYGNQAAFLANERNKKAIVSEPRKHLSLKGFFCTVSQR